MATISLEHRIAGERALHPAIKMSTTDYELSHVYGGIDIFPRILGKYEEAHMKQPHMPSIAASPEGDIHP